jgi:hypothetical protein
MAIEEKIDSEPTALRVFAELVAYAHTAGQPTFSQALFIGPENSSLRDYLNYLGVDLRPIRDFQNTEAISGAPIVLLDAADSSFVVAAMPGLREFLTLGKGPLVVWGPDDASIGQLKYLVADVPSICQADYPHLLSVVAPETDGMHPGWLYWLKGPEQGRSIVSRGFVFSATSSVEDLIVAPTFDWRAYVGQGETTRTAAILRSERELPPERISALSRYGMEGQAIYFCMLRREAGLPKNDAIVRTFLTNLGVRVDPFGMIGDTDNDGSVGPLDLFLYSRCWQGLIGEYEGWSDLVLDGEIGESDLVRLLESWHARGALVPEGPKAGIGEDFRAISFSGDRIAPEQYLERIGPH